MSESVVYNGFKNLYDDNAKTLTYIVDVDGKVISHSDKSLIGKDVPDNEILLDVFEDDGFSVQKIGENKYAFLKKIPGYDFIIVSIVPAKSIYSETFLIRNLIIYILIGCLIFGLAIGYIVAYNLTKPIKLLSYKMNEVENGDFNVSVDINTNDEMGYLARHFNSMVTKIRTLIRDLYEVRIKEKEAELKALQEQINPHFLYNTLDTIRWTARTNGDFESSEYIEILSDILRNNLNNGQYETSIGSEVKNLKNYLFLQQKRYGDRMKVEIDIPESLYGYKIIKLVLQPIVENAINYGIAPNDSNGLISIMGRLEGEEIILEVSDNGLGVDEGVINEIINSDTETDKIYALKNINERIKYHFGDEYGLYFSSRLNEGTKVKVIIPAIKSPTGIDDY
jgi:two-component system sensor histidine kinase YesM